MTDRRPGPHRIDVHAHYLAPAYKDALREAEMWLIGGIPVPEWTPQLALEFMELEDVERAGALAQFGHLGRPGLPRR